MFFLYLQISKNIIPMRLTVEEELEFVNATKCHICNKNFQPDDVRVRDHCHYTGN